MQRMSATLSLAVLANLAAASAQAEDKPPPAWSDTLKFSGYLDVGIQTNPDHPRNDLNWGRLYDDRDGSLELNQFSLIATRPTDPNATGYDFGFTLQGMYGSDARYTHFLGQFARATHARTQFTFLEADALVHAPWFSDGGVDAKIGEYPDPLSAETTTPGTNPFYSHSYIFNYGIPVAHLGVLTTTHLTPMIDLWFGLDTGNQTTLTKGGDNNGAIAGIAGIGFNLLDGNITILALSHMGPENPRGAVDFNGNPIKVNSAFRYFNTITTIVKWNDDITFTTDLNLVRDDGVNANAYGIAQYASYAIDEMFTLQARGEVWRDDKGFFVAGFPGTFDSINALAGRANTSIAGPKATYGEITLGVNIKPPMPDLFTGAVIRPEVRYDSTLNNARPFGTSNSTSGHMFTIGADFVLPF